MKCYVYIDFSLVDDARTVGFSTGHIERSTSPEVGQFLRIGEPEGVEGIKTDFLITQIVEPDRDIPGNDGVSWIVTCDDNFFEARSDIHKTVQYLEGHGFVFDEFNKV